MLSEKEMGFFRVLRTQVGVGFSVDAPIGEGVPTKLWIRFHNFSIPAVLVAHPATEAVFIDPSALAETGRRGSRLRRIQRALDSSKGRLTLAPAPEGEFTHHGGWVYGGDAVLEYIPS